MWGLLGCKRPLGVGEGEFLLQWEFDSLARDFMILSRGPWALGPRGAPLPPSPAPSGEVGRSLGSS